MSLRASLAFLLLLPACVAEKDDTKGVVDESAPPSIPTEAGKSDNPAHEVALFVESPHPYTNSFNRKYHLDLASVLPGCANRVRVHFSILRTEAGYDYVDLEVGGAVVESFDGTHDDTWSSWFSIHPDGMEVRLTTDSSVTRHGFVVDKVEWDGGASDCPIYPLQPCPEGSFHVSPPVDECSCPLPPSCAGAGAITIDHVTARGFMHVGKRTVGFDASTLGTGPADGIEATPIGTIDVGRMETLIAEAAQAGVLIGDGYDHGPGADGTREVLSITVGPRVTYYVAPPGGHDPAVSNVINAFEALFLCAEEDPAITCGSGNSCIDLSCQPDDWCACEEIYQPVCGVDGRTYGNQCHADCTEMPVAHTGECGQVGDQCAGRVFPGCLDDNKCRYDVSTWQPPFRDASGVCVARTYCDAPTDCNGLPAPAVLGAWACEANTCAFHAGPNWRDVTGFRFATAHPYGNSTSVWKELYAPIGTQAIRLVVNGTFNLERNYDFLEVWSWTNGAWTRVRRYTGTTAPALTEELPGRYFYLKFVSDSTVTAHGFDVTAQYR